MNGRTSVSNWMKAETGITGQPKDNCPVMNSESCRFPRLNIYLVEQELKRLPFSELREQNQNLPSKPLL
ncbi:MAG: hypothetical protein MZV64_35750 [Ignavibacteriales bacterium]|nr:hypothetical protein [Ignavibacteriales bacterium]